MPPRKHMTDACKLGTFVEVSTGPYPTEEWTFGNALRCRFSRVSTREVMDGARVASTDVAIAVPAGTTVAPSSRVELTKRNNATLAPPEYYDVIGEPWPVKGNREIILNCQHVPAGAV